MRCDLFEGEGGRGVLFCGEGFGGEGVGLDFFDDLVGVEGLMCFAEGFVELGVMLSEAKDDRDLVKVAVVEGIEISEEQRIVIFGMEEITVHGVSPHEAMCSRNRLRARKMRTRMAPGEDCRRCAISLAE